MPNEPTGTVLRLLRDLAGNPTGQPTPDGALVDQFVRARSEVAFETLLRRHGPMVLRLCRRFLGHEQDAEDVFQATFLVLAERAHTLRKSAAVGPWLFGVALRLARKHRARAARRRQQPVPVQPSPEDPLARLSVLEAERILHEELATLPERYRGPLVLCYLQGKTRDEAARALGYRLGTFKDRLDRARHLLERRLTRRGVGLSSTLAVGLVADAHASAALTSALVQGTTRAAVTGMAGPAGAVSPSVRALARAGLRSLLVTPARIAGGVLLATALVASVIGMGTSGPPATSPPGSPAELPAIAGGGQEKAAQQAVDALGDPLPPGAVRRIGTLRHRVPPWWLGLPDGRSYLTVHGQIRRIDADSGRVLETWPVPAQAHPAGFSPDGRRVLFATSFVFYTGLRAPGQKDEQKWALTLYDLAQRKAVWEQSAMLEPKDWKPVDTACFSADGRWIATVGQGGQAGRAIRLWDGRTGKELWGRPGQFLQPLGFSAGGDTLVLRGNYDIYLFDRGTGQQRRSFPTLSPNEGRMCTLAPDGSTVLLGTAGATVRAWDVTTGKELPPLTGHKQGATFATFSPDGKLVATGGGDACILVHAWPSRQLVQRIEIGHHDVERMAISGDARRVQVLFWGEQALHSFDLGTGKKVRLPRAGHDAGVWGVAATPDGKLLSFSKDATVRTWDPGMGQAVARLRVEKDLNAGGFAVSSDGRLLAVPGSSTDAVCIHERASGRLIRKLPAQHGVMKHLVFSPDGRWLAAAEGTSSNVQVWDVETGRTVFQAHYRLGYGGMACAFSPDGRQFAASDEGRVRFWDVGTWKEQPGMEAYANMGLAFSPDGRTLATASVQGIGLYELATGRVRVHLIPAWYSPHLTFSSDGRWLAYAANPNVVQVWDVYRGKVLGPFPGHDDAVTGLAFTDGDRLLASSSEDTTVLLWDVAAAAARTPPPKPGDVAKAWQTLAGADAPAAHEAIRVLANSPDAALPLLAEHLKPVGPTETEKIRACLRDLDSTEFAVRDRATQDLEHMGERATAALERFLADKPSLEARKRAERLLAKARGPVRDPERRRQVRALEALERMDNEAARRLLETLAHGNPDASLTRDARRSLDRCERRAFRPSSGLRD